MNTRSTPGHYSPAQIVLHWVVVVGFIIQMIISESIVRTLEALNSGLAPDTTDNILAWVHVSTGSTILLAVLARLYLRFRYGAPGPAPGTSAMEAKMATVMHWTLYALLIGMAATGMLTWNGIAALGDVHFYINVALFFLVLGHAGVAVYHQFVRKDGTLRRMWSSSKNTEANN